jgi:hypothetical protein
VPRSLFQGGARRSPPQVVPPCYAGAEGAARLGALPCWPSVPRWAWSRRCPSCAAVTRIKGMAQRLLMIAALASVFPSGILNPPRGYRPASMVGSSPRANRSRKQRAPATTLICASVAASERPLSGSTARSSCPDRSRPRRRPRHGRARSGCGPAGLPVRSCQARATPSTRTTRSTRSVGAGEPVPVVGPSMQRAKVFRDVACIEFGHSEIRHRRERTDPLRIAQPLDHVLRRVRQDTGQILPARDAVQRRTDKANRRR